MAFFSFNKFCRGVVFLACWHCHCDLDVLDALMLRIMRAKFLTDFINFGRTYGLREANFNYSFRNRSMLVRGLCHYCIQVSELIESRLDFAQFLRDSMLNIITITLLTFKC